MVGKYEINKFKKYINIESCIKNGRVVYGKYFYGTNCTYTI